MSPIGSVETVLGMIQKSKQNAAAFCTNFFPVQSKLQTWIDHGELEGEADAACAIFLKKDHDFKRLYFCAGDLRSLGMKISEKAPWPMQPMTVDLVGNESGLGPMLDLFHAAGFQTHTRLQRLSRRGKTESEPDPRQDANISFATGDDCQGIGELLEKSFNRYGEQIPEISEIQSAIASRQILIARLKNEIAGLLFFETQGFASTVRFWVVGEKFRAFRLGSSLMRKYFALQNKVQRFTLWVQTDNQSAIEKYRHYDYSPDGLLDYVLANRLICS